jgi:hypothetical protein
MFEQKNRFRPYDAEALGFYRENTGERMTAQKAQAAIVLLRAKTPSLIWKSAKGEYALDDTAMYQWFEKRHQEGTWPPVGPIWRIRVRKTSRKHQARERSLAALATTEACTAAVMQLRGRHLSARGRATSVLAEVVWGDERRDLAEAKRLAQRVTDRGGRRMEHGFSERGA